MAHSDAEMAVRLDPSNATSRKFIGIAKQYLASNAVAAKRTQNLELKTSSTPDAFLPPAPEGNSP